MMRPLLKSNFDLIQAFTGLILGVLISNPSLAAEPPDLLIFPSSETKTTATEVGSSSDLSNEEFKVLYDPRIDGEIHTVTAPTRRESLKTTFDQQSEILRNGPVQDRTYIPLLPTSPEDFNELLKMSDQDIETFLSRKTAFLNRFSKVLEKFRLKSATINKAVLEINQRFFNSRKVIAKSNTIGGGAMFSVSAGLALPKKMMDSLKKTRIGKHLPESGGFYYLLGLGAGLSRTESGDNGMSSAKRTWVLDLYLDVERLKSTLTGIAEVSAAGTYGIVYESREGNFPKAQTDVTYGGVAGVFRGGENQFGWAASTGMSFPPGIGAFLVFQDVGYRFYLLRVDKSGAHLPALALIKESVLEIAASWYQQARRKAGLGLSCRRVLLN
jgi:hypothetical protein